MPSIAKCLGRFDVTLLVLVTTTVLFMESTGAQSYPSRPIRLVHGFATGSAVDVFARPLAQRLSEALGHQVIVDAHPGATGTIANEIVAKSPGDGYTLLASPGSAMAATPHLYKVNYAPLRDFAPIIQITDFSYVLVSHLAVPATNARELIALAKKRPGYLTYGSTGVGSGFHLAGELFCSMAGIQMLHVPYRGGGSAAIADLLAGRVDLTWDSLAVVKPQMDAGKLRAIGVTGSRRAAALPKVPTIAESGLPGYEMVGWHGIFAPAATPKEIVVRLNGLIGKILGTPEIKSLWNTQGMEIVPSTPEQFAARLRSDYDRYEKLIKSSGIRIQQ
ncbi:MAG TPA: tripartite tricarboxylate transporter substrate binding protein [Burkholderiales bacterium]|nr:tripartite tricarboxylate transporter substrate binding protein [Burkholderiales bacterium]